jgi:hypothetical protein
VSEAPKILWYDDQDCSAGPVQFGDDEIKYVRADLVEGLVEALEEAVAGMGGSYAIWSITAKAALKALESAEIGRGME